MNFRKLKSPILALLALFGTVATLQAQRDTASKMHAFTLQQTIDYAMKHNLSLTNAQLDVKLQEQVNREVTSATYPQISGSLNTTYNPLIATQVLPNFISPATYGVLIDQGVKDGNGNPIVRPSDFGFISAQFGTKYSATVGLSLQQLLFDGQVFIGLQARSAVLDFAKKNVEVTAEDIKANIYKIYYQLALSKTQIALLDANIDRYEKLLKDTKIIYDNGFAEKLDVNKVSVAITNLRTEKTKVINAVSNGFYGLKLLIGMPVNDQIELTENITDQDIKDGMLGYEAYSYTDRKDYQYAELGKKLNEFNIRRYKLSQLPTVSLGGNYAKNAQRNKFNFFNDGPWFSIAGISLNASIPIFDGFAKKAKIEQAKIELSKTENNISLLEQKIDNDVAVARVNFKTALVTMDSHKQNMELAETVYNQTKKKYEIGTGSQTEINAAQTELKTAQTNYISAMYDAIIARTDFLKAIGKL